MSNKQEESKLSKQVRKHLKRYFKELDGEQTRDLYNIVLEQVEKPMLETVMKQVNNNQTRASDLLGLNRGTLRKKLKQYDML